MTYCAEWELMVNWLSWWSNERFVRVLQIWILYLSCFFLFALVVCESRLSSVGSVEAFTSAILDIPVYRHFITLHLITQLFITDI